MRRLGRILLNALTVLSLFLFVATVVLWVRGYWGMDEFSYIGSRRVIGVSNPRGDVAIYHGSDPTNFRRGFQHTRIGALTLTRQLGRPHRSWGMVRLWPATGISGKIIAIPAWLLAALFAATPIYQALRWHRRRARRSSRLGLCPS